MSERVAITYVRCLFGFAVLNFAVALSLHLSVLILGSNQAYAKCGVPLFRGAVIVWILAIAYQKDGIWMYQIRTCPPWMWKGAMTIGVYSLFITCVDLILSRPTSLPNLALAVSGVPLGFDAIAVCMLHSVLWSGFLKKSEIARRALGSVVFVTLSVTVLLAYRAGYLPNPGRR